MKDGERVNILCIRVDKVDRREALEKAMSFLKTGGAKAVFTPNTEMVMAALEDRELRHILNNGDLVVPDGIGLVYASRKYGSPLPERVAGYDLMMDMLDALSEEGRSIFLLGGEPGTAEKAAERIKSLFPGIEIRGCHHGYFDEQENDRIVETINSAKPDVLFVAMGAPKQEKWIYRFKDRLDVKMAMGVGGSLDVLAGKVKRAPVLFRKLGLEWFYRLITQPWRARRMIALPRFALRVLLDRKVDKAK